MSNWWAKEAPRAASARFEDLIAQIRDDGKQITVRLERGHVPFELYLTRKQSWGGVRGYYSVQDLMGNGFATPKWFGMGVGTFLCNIGILYLQALDEDEFPEVRGTPYQTDADPPGHHQLRQDFFRSFGANWLGPELRAPVRSLQARWGVLPFGRSHAPVAVRLEDFEEQ